jgi:hypothetical protein
MPEPAIITDPFNPYKDWKEIKYPMQKEAAVSYFIPDVPKLEFQISFLPVLPEYLQL